MGGRGSSSGMRGGGGRGSSSPALNLNSQQERAVNLARNQLNFDRGFAEIPNNRWSNVNMSNERMVSALNASDSRYSYEYRVETTPGNVFTGGAPVIHRRIYRRNK